MNLEKLKAQQAALKAHSSSQEQLTGLVKTFADGCPALSAAIVQEFAILGLRPTAGGGPVELSDGGFAMVPFVVTVPPSERSLKIEVWAELTFDQDRFRSVFKKFGFGEIMPPQPMALPVEITVYNPFSTDFKSSIWWHGPRDNERLAAIVVDMFNEKRGPLEVSSPNCFVATAVFGERSEEVAILRKWRDERLFESIVGRAIVKAYYGLGPFCAVIVQGNAVVRRLVRAVLLVACRRLSRRT
jgi:hypothetical protein